MNKVEENDPASPRKVPYSNEQLSALAASVKSQKMTSFRGWRYFFAAFVLGISIALIIIKSYQSFDSVSVLFDYLVSLLALVYIIYLLIEKNWKENTGLFLVSEKVAEPIIGKPTSSKSQSPVSSQPQNHAAPFLFQKTPEEEIFEKPISESRSLSSRVKDLQSVFLDAGLTLSCSFCQDILSGISSSHLLVLSGVEETKQILFYEALCRYFGCQNFFQKYDGVSLSKEALFVRSQEGGFLRPTPFLSGLAEAKKNQNTISLLGLSVAQASSIKSYLAPFEEYFAFPSRGDVLSLSSSNIHGGDGNVWASQIVLPRNIFVVLFLNDKEMAWDLPLCLLKDAFVINCSCSTKEATSASKTPFAFAPSLSFFLSARLECEKESFVDESDWKKLDMLEQTLWKRNPFGNPEDNQMDDFSSLKIAMGATSLASVDSLLAEKILPCAFASCGASLFGGETPLDAVLDKQFGEGRLPLATPYCEKARTLLKLRAEANSAQSEEK